MWGIDAFLASRIIRENGKVIGINFTENMPNRERIASQEKVMIAMYNVRYSDMKDLDCPFLICCNKLKNDFLSILLPF